MKYTCLLLIVCSALTRCAVGACSVPNNIKSADLRRFAPELMNLRQSDRARDSLVKLASSDSSIMNELANVVPFWVEKCKNDPMWVNIVRLTEKLKLTSAAPALVEALDRKYYESPIVTAYTAEHLVYDPVGRALAAIGDPAIPALSHRWNQLSNPAERSRIAVILEAIGTPAAAMAMRQQLAKESDPWVKGIINSRLRLIQSH